MIADQQTGTSAISNWQLAISRKEILSMIISESWSAAKPFVSCLANCQLLFANVLYPSSSASS
jgi:hypothetical protein